MSASRKQRLVSALVWLMFAGVASFGFREGGRELSIEIRSSRWEETHGVIRSIEAHRASRRAYYGFDVGGDRYDGTYHYMVNPSRVIPLVGARVAVFYDPDDPTDSTLHRGVRFDGGSPVILSSLVIVAGLIAAPLMRQIGRRRRLESDRQVVVPPGDGVSSP